MTAKPLNIPKYTVGQAVVYFPPRGVAAAQGAYRVTAKLLSPSGRVEYRIKHQFEGKRCFYAT